MAKTARRYDIYLPLTFNDHRAIPAENFDMVEERLLTKFGGVTAQSREFPLRGSWVGDRRIFLDQVIVITALDFHRSGSAKFMADLKRDLLRDFDQLAILITETVLRVH